MEPLWKPWQERAAALGKKSGRGPRELWAGVASGQTAQRKKWRRRDKRRVIMEGAQGGEKTLEEQEGKHAPP